MRTAKFKITKDSAGEWRWKLIAANGEIVASGEGYTLLKDARRGVDDVRRCAAVAEIVVPKSTK